MTNKWPLVIVGAGGHGRVVADLCHVLGLELAGFIDDASDLGEVVDGVPRLGGRTLLEEAGFLAAHEFFVAIGDSRTRREFCTQIRDGQGALATLVHPRAMLAGGVVIGTGSVVMAGAVINTGSRIGDYAVVNTGAVVDHDNHVEEGVHISPGCVLAGTVTCRRDSFIGTGANIVPRVEIGARAVVAAGATVTRDVDPDCLVAGCPAVVKRRYSSPG